MRSWSLVLLLAGCHGKDDQPTDEPGCDEGGGCVIAEDLAAGLLSVQAFADDDVWIVGGPPASDEGPVVVRYDGEGWETLDTSAFPGIEIWWAWVSGEEVVFVGSEGAILTLDRAPGALSQTPGPDPSVQFFGVWGASADELWAVGTDATVWRREEGTWARFDVGVDLDGVDLFKVHGTSASDIWMVGSLGASLYFDGTDWEKVATDAEASTATAPLLTVNAGGDQPIAVGGAGNGLILEFDGVWRDVSPDFQPGFNGVCTGGGDAWAVGLAGARALRTSDGTWSPDNERDVETSTFLDWHACAISPGGDLWTVGGRISTRPLQSGVVAFMGSDKPPDLAL